MLNISKEDYYSFYASYDGPFNMVMASKWADDVSKNTEEDIINLHFKHPLSKPREILFAMIQFTLDIQSFILICRTIRIKIALVRTFKNGIMKTDVYKLIFIKKIEYLRLKNNWKFKYGEDFNGYKMMVKQLIIETKLPDYVKTIQ